MSPFEFQKRMSAICRGTNINMVAMAGLQLVDAALGDCAHDYLIGICDWLNRLSELRGKVRKEFGPPRADTVGKPQMGEGAL